MTNEIEHLKEIIKLKDDHNRELVTRTYEGDQTNIRQTITELERQLERVMGQRDEITKEFTIRLNALSDRTEAKIQPIADQLHRAGKPDWTLLIGLASVFLVIVSGIYFLISQQIAVSSAPITLAVEALKVGAVPTEARLRTLETDTSTSKSADVESRSDRARLNTRVGDLETGLATLDASRREKEASQAAALVEIETQFCAADAFRNLMHVADLRNFAILWQRTAPGETYPTDNAYYPVICNRPAR